jgi:hypothetical protein
MTPSLRSLALLGALAAASCAVEVGAPVHEVVYERGTGTDNEPIYVNESPPPPREEVIVGLAPAPGYVWVGGYWTRRPAGWTWVDGRWISPPRPGAQWVPGHWDRHPRGHIWISGHWR